jgi:predicted outer membrane repeat protein
MAVASFRAAKVRLEIAAVLGLVAVAGVALFGPRAPLASGPIIVNNTTDPASTSDNGFCTLREAINNANSPGTDTSGGDCTVPTGEDTIINFSVSGTIALGVNGTLPAIVNTLTTDGSGQTITVSGGGTYQVLLVNVGATLNLNDLTIADGYASSPPSGVGRGGGIRNDGTLTVTNSTFSGNSASYVGGGIYSGGALPGTSAGALTVTNSTFSGNSAQYGGGIFGPGTVTNSTFSGNSASFLFGGGI